MVKQKRSKLIVMAGALLLAFLVMPLDRSSKTNTTQLLIPKADAAEVSSTFKWHAARPGITRAQIALGRAVTLPFDFTITGKVARVKFSIPKKFVDMGIDLGDDEVAVKGGKASSTVLFAAPPGKPLGKFDLVITAVDSATGKEIGKGTIQFMLLPPGVGGC